MLHIGATTGNTAAYAAEVLWKNFSSHLMFLAVPLPQYGADGHPDLLRGYRSRPACGGIAGDTFEQTQCRKPKAPIRRRR
jgi:hypothetical protein